MCGVLQLVISVRCVMRIPRADWVWRMYENCVKKNSMCVVCNCKLDV